MSKPTDQEQASQPKSGMKSNKPTLTELSPEELRHVSGGTTNAHKVQTSDLTIMKVVDKTSPN